MFHIREFLESHSRHNPAFGTVAVDGRGASGKTTFAQYLRDLLPGYVLLSGDDYFEPVTDKPEWGEFNTERFEHDVIEPLRIGRTFMYYPFDWHTEPHISERMISVTDGFCLERCFSFSLGLDWDLKIWIDTPKDICLERGVSRETVPHERALSVWRDVWQPREDEYIARTRPQESADLVVDGTRSFTEQVGL